MLGNRFHVRSHPFRNRFACDGRCLGRQKAEAAEHYSTIKISKGDSAQKTLSQMLMPQGSVTSTVPFHSFRPHWKALQLSHSKAFTATQHFLPTVCPGTRNFSHTSHRFSALYVRSTLPENQIFQPTFHFFILMTPINFMDMKKNDCLNSEFCNR